MVSTMTPQDKEKLLIWGERLSQEIQIILVSSEDHRISNVLNEFLSTLSSLLPKVIIHERKAEKGSGPAIEIHKRLWFRAVPLGPELEPFLEALMVQKSLPEESSEPLYRQVNKVNVPAMLKLYIAPQCPFCPSVVKKLVPLVFASESIHLQVIDGIMFPELAERDGIQSAPTVVLDDIRWTGSIQLEEVAEVICSRDLEGLSSATLSNMIQEGGASKVAHLMIERRKIFPKFIDLLVDEKWTVRLGAMVAVEEIMENDPWLASQVIEPIWRRFQSLDDQTKGDMIYLTGEIGGIDAIPYITSASKKLPSDELRVVAKEAIESIKLRHD